MNIRTTGILFLLLGIMTTFMVGCPASNSPSAPAGPANTATFTPTFSATCGNATGTCTLTETFTATNSPTETPTSTASPTATETPSRTPSRTATDSPTQTESPTPSNTPTITPTKTPTNSPTNTTSPLPTNTPSNSPTKSPTASPTNTVLNTPTLCYTPSQTPTVSTSQGFQINVTYSPGGVSTTNPIRFYIWDSGGPNSGNGANRKLTTNGGTLTYYTNSAGTGGFAAWYDAGGVGRDQPQPGDHGVIYNNSGCNLGVWTTITVNNGAITNLGTLTFSTTNTFYGFGGTLSYGGSAGGSVDYCAPLVMAMYSDASYTTMVNGTQTVFSSGAKYGDFDPANLCATGSYYVQAWYAKSGSYNSPGGGDPVTQLGLRSSLNTATFNITVP